MKGEDLEGESRKLEVCLKEGGEEVERGVGLLAMHMAKDTVFQRL